MNKNRFSRIGFILAAAGSAVGLGNIWKFPYITGENGGGVFVLVYLFTVLLIGMSIFIGEVLLGSRAHKDAVSTFEQLAPEGKKYWKYSGFTFLTGLLILSFYAVVIGWIFNYIVLSVTHLPSTVAEAETLFMGLLKENIGSQILYYSISFMIITYTISKGVKKGIEKINNVLMPALIFLLLGMLLYTIQLPGFGQAVSFMFEPNFEKFNSSSIIIAVGHAFFTLSIGMVTILTYASSLGKDTNIVKASLIVVFMDTLIAIVAGLIIFSILFTNGAEPGKGAGLVFITLPAIFYEMGLIGNVLSVSFFVALAFAGITSAVSILEPTVMYLVERLKIERKKATYSTMGFLYFLGLLALLSNTNEFSSFLTFGGKNLFDLFDFTSSAILMPVGGIIVAVFVGYVMDREVVRNTLQPLMGNFFYSIWLISIRFITPIAITILMLKEIGIISI